NTTSAFSAGQVITLGGTKGGRDVPASTFVVTGTNTLSDLMTFMQGNLGIFGQGNGTGQVPDDLDPTTPQPGVTLDSSPGDPANTMRLSVTGNLGKENALEIPGSGFTDASGVSPLDFADGTNSSGIT